ncbi:hypothetical protein SNEBB_007952 [Seison nebaliae]|nr:hypothetical protein SNEBB_007952 [Seison nebaliae]
MTDKNKQDFYKPSSGFLYSEDVPKVVLCKPKILPLKSSALNKMQKMNQTLKEIEDKQNQVAINEENTNADEILRFDDN